MPNPRTQSTKDNARKPPNIPQGEQDIEVDNQSEFSVNEALNAAAKEEESKPQRQSQADKKPPTEDTESEFSVSGRREQS
jgi:hypothetical protein